MRVMIIDDLTSIARKINEPELLGKLNDLSLRKSHCSQPMFLGSLVWLTSLNYSKSL